MAGDFADGVEARRGRRGTGPGRAAACVTGTAEDAGIGRDATAEHPACPMGRDDGAKGRKSRNDLART